MANGIWPRWVLVGMLGVFAHVVHAQSTQPGTMPAYSTEAIQTAAMRAYVRFNQAQAGSGETEGRPIPREFWTDALRSLEPVRVYSHRANIVVVQHEADGVESGQYIPLLISSYAPESGVDRFEFTPNPRDRGKPPGTVILKYRRTAR